MQMAVVGSGYVGLTTAVCFARLGHKVVCVDIDKKKIKQINKGKSPISESGLENILQDALKKKLLSATTDVNKAVSESDIVFICVGTPSKKDGTINLDFIKSASRDIGRALKECNDFKIVVVKSTVIPGTTERIIIPALEKTSGKKSRKNFGICVNPEFLQEGAAIKNFLYPDRIVLGLAENDKGTKQTMRKLYSGFTCPFMFTNLKTAEMIKYANNCFLATKISFINEIGNVCKKAAIDVDDIAAAIGLDYRINPNFLKAGCGFGGSCFPKDVKAIVAAAKRLGYKPKLLEAVLAVNERQPEIIVNILKKKLGVLKDKQITVLGLAFKAQTDDVRDSRTIPIIKNLLKNKARVVAYDPLATKNMKKIFSPAQFPIRYANSAKAALEKADGCLILTGWPEFKNLGDGDFTAMRKKIIIEGRRILDAKKISKKVCDYEGICW